MKSLIKNQYILLLLLLISKNKLTTKETNSKFVIQNEEKKKKCFWSQVGLVDTIDDAVACILVPGRGRLRTRLVVALVAESIVLEAFGAVPDTVAEVDNKAQGHPHGETNPCLVIKQSHQVKVDKHAQQRQRRNKRHL